MIGVVVLGVWLGEKLKSTNGTVSYYSIKESKKWKNQNSKNALIV
jgi:hypothetical protein